MEKLNTHQIEELLFFEKNADEKIIQPMIELLNQQISYMIPDMQVKAIQKDFNRLSQIAHSLKSSALQLGLKTAAELCLTLETEGRRNVNFPFEQVIFDLEIEFKESLIELEKYLTRQTKTGPLAC